MKLNKPNGGGCVNWQPKKGCRAIAAACEGRECPFFASAEDYVNAKTKTAERLRSLDINRQLAIAEKYYPKIGVWWDAHK